MALITSPPTATTQAASSVTAVSAVLNGNILDTGQWTSGGIQYTDTIAEKGFYWSTSPDPKTTGTKVIVAGNVTGAYTYNLTGLVVNTTYYFVAYSRGTNSGLTGYGTDKSFSYMTPLDTFRKYYIYKIYNHGQYLGNLPSVISEYSCPQDINTSGSQIIVECAVSSDTSALPVESITDENGEEITDETDDILTTDGQIPIVTPGNSGINTLIKNGNGIKVFEYSYYYPNGKQLFSGIIERWESPFGGEDSKDSIIITAYSDGQDLDSFLVRGYPYTYTLDQSQATQNASNVISQSISGQSHYLGQTLKANATNLAAVSLLLNGSATVKISVYSGIFGTLLGSVTKSVSVGSATEVQFALPVSIPTTVGAVYSFSASVSAGQSITVYYKNTDVYANGDAYQYNFYGGNAGTWLQVYGSLNLVGCDLYFKTYSGTGSTTATFSNMDPSNMLKTFMDDYIIRGGIISYNSSTVDLTGLSLTYAMNTNTILEGIKAILSLAPNNFYYYVDLGTNLLHFESAGATPDIVLTKGKHLSRINLVATIENVKNSVNFTGGATAGVNLYKQYNDSLSIDNYGIRLDRMTDNRVTVSATADAIGGSDLAEKKDEQYQTSVTILDTTMDITLLKPGMIVGFNGFATFVDYIVAQIVRLDYHPSYVTLTLGILPKRMNPDFDKITRELIALQTIINPTAPS